MPRPAHRIVDLATSVPWAIRPESLEAILTIAAREHTPDMLAVATRAGEREAELRGLTPEAITTGQGVPLPNASAARLRGPVCVLPIEGPIFRYANLFSDISGASSLEMLAGDLKLALANPDVKAILLHVDSPGGEVNGTGEFADLLYAARGQKPLVAYISHEGASAAYWIASAADRVIASPTSIVGSIGVIATFADPHKTNAGKFQFVSSQSPMKRPDPHTAEGHAEIQRTVDALAGEFVNTVARNRGVTPETVVERYGKGGVLVGQQAVAAGLADALGSFESCLAQLEGDLAAQETPDSPALLTPPPPDEATASIQPAHADVPATATDTPPRTPMPNLWERIQSRFGADASPDDDAVRAAVRAELGESPVAAPSPAAVANPTPAAAATAGANAETPEMRLARERIAALESANRDLRIARIQEQAVAYAQTTITAGRAFPVEEGHIVADFVQASLDDEVLGAVSTADGTKTTRVALLRARYDARPDNMLTKEQLGHAAFVLGSSLPVTPRTGAADAPASPEEVRKLIEATPLGRAAMQGRA